ncbi:MAG: 30S ribosomal protein S18 [Endomicrobiia bacterium]
MISVPQQKKFISKAGKNVVKKNIKCHFCATNTEPDYKNIAQLKSFISEKFKILSRKTTKLCAKHQRRVAKEIKYARMLALLPFVAKYK